MSNISLIVYDELSMGFYSKYKIVGMPDISYKAVIGIGQINRELSVESPSLSVELNADIAHLIFENPPVGKQAEVYYGEEEIFSGSIKSISISENITIQIEA